MKDTKKKYNTLVCEVVRFEGEDVITSSVQSLKPVNSPEDYEAYIAQENQNL